MVETPRDYNPGLCIQTLGNPVFGVFSRLDGMVTTFWYFRGVGLGVV